MFHLKAKNTQNKQQVKMAEVQTDRLQIIFYTVILGVPVESGIFTSTTLPITHFTDSQTLI